jgi:hypothetical protein
VQLNRIAVSAHGNNRRKPKLWSFPKPFRQVVRQELGQIGICVILPFGKEPN